MSFNTTIRYTKMPDDDDFSINETECILRCEDPYVSYNAKDKSLLISGKDVQLKTTARNVYIEKV